MSKYSKSTGPSYTEPNKGTNKLKRGINFHKGRIRSHGEYAGSTQIKPEAIPEFFWKDPDLLIRQTISMLDKVIRKPRSLRNMALETYIDRTAVSIEIWKLLEKGFSTLFKEVDADAELKRLEEMWLSKVHPYAKNAFDPYNISNDENAIYIKRVQKDKDTKDTRSAAEGAWHAALWITIDGKADYLKSAMTILGHVYKSEFKIGLDRDTQKPVQRYSGENKKGAAESRGHALQNSTNDPRDQSPKKALRDIDWNSALAEKYFSQDIAAIIYDALINLQNEITKHNNSDSEEKAKHPPRLEKNFFGKLFYDHFGKIAPKFENDDIKNDLFPIHDAVRLFYRKLSEGERLKRALSSGNESVNPKLSLAKSEGEKKRIAAAEIAKIVPRNFTQFKQNADAKSANTDMSRYIRLGKLIVHSSDIGDPSYDPDVQYQENLKHFITSDGQGEIKRNESFTRLWRNSVGLSMRSLKGLVDKEEEVQITGRKPLKIENQDLSAPSIAAKAIKHLKHDKFAEQAALMFGKKPIQQEDISRVSFITEGSEIEQKETVWALLRIAGEIRNRTNHFTTRSRLSELFSKSVVSPTPEIEDKKFGSAERGGNKVSVKAADRLTRMMKFDLGLRKQLIVDDLNQLKAAEFLSKDQVNALFSEMSNIKSNSTITTPKYIAMLRKIEALALDSDNELDDPLVPFAKLDLKNLALKGANENQCRIGILRYLYNSGFLNWLEDTQNSSSALKKTIELVAATKKRRSETAQITKDQHYVYSESWLETLADEDKEDIVQFSSKLAAIAVSDGKTVQNYRPQKKEQSSRSKEIEALRQEIFAHLFSTYIQDRNLSWIWTFNLIEDAEGEMVTGENAEIDNFDISPWHAQFYAWLYLIPTDDVAKLRHQFRKTAALEEKSAGDLDDKLKQALAEMDHLMSLYTKVQGAGFDGTEHQNYFGLETSLYENDKLINEDTGEEKTLFDVVFSADNEDHHASIPGTRRGLRQMLRYGHFNALEGIFERHKVSSEEVKKFINLSHADTKALFQDKINLQTSIVEASKDKDFDEDELIAMAEKYQASAIEVHKYNFEINSARLTEFSKLHQLMMHIIGRLTDFTLIWERDRIYSFLGMLFLQLKEANSKLVLAHSSELELPEVLKNKPTILGFSLPNSMRLRLNEAYKEHFFSSDTKKNDTIAQKIEAKIPLEQSEYNHLQSKTFVELGFLPLWSESFGFCLSFFELYKLLLDEPNRAVFERHFVGTKEQHLKDQKSADRTIRDMGKNAKVRPPLYKLGRQQIRNDFAHYNVIGKAWTWREGNARKQTPENFEQGKRQRLNLSFLVNAVRSLLSYDRKLKNAVSQSISRILEEEGLYLKWEMKHDRLINARICPMTMPQLSMLRGPVASECRFSLPKTSVRYTSMVQALFEFSNSGNRSEVRIGTALKSKGPVNYPETKYWDFDANVPTNMLYDLPSMLNEHGRKK